MHETRDKSSQAAPGFFISPDSLAAKKSPLPKMFRTFLTRWYVLLTMARSSNKMALTTLLRRLWVVARQHKISSIVIVLISAGVILIEQYSSAAIGLLSAILVALSQYGGESPVAPTKPPKGAEWICLIEEVSDGDTVTAQCGSEKMRVRLFGIDAPETRQAPWGNWSRDKLATMIKNSRVTIKVRDMDRYGRTVGQIFDNKNQDVGLEMVRQGYAAVYVQYNPDKNYQVVQQQAQQAKRGIWSKPGAHQTPWEWRKVNPR